MIIKERRIVKDEQGMPNYMTAYTWTGCKDPARVPPMFVICGEVVDTVLVSQYHNAEVRGIPCSLPFQRPWVSVSQDEAAALCRKKGKGWHLLTNAEYAFLLAESRELGTEPHGNTEYGKDHDHQEEEGVCFDRARDLTARTLTGSGPVTWSHDHTESGVYDLKGNVWERCQGLRLVHGEVQYIKDNDAAAAEVDTSAKSHAWVPIRLENGHTVKLDIHGSNVVITTEEVEGGWDGAHMKDVELDGLEEVPQALLDLAILPPDYKTRKDGIFVDSDLAEAVPLRGSSFGSTSNGGVSAVNLHRERSHVSAHVGFRSALYLKNGKPFTE